jgi:hypothetical protein
MVPEVEVFGSGRPEMDAGVVQEIPAAASRTAKENIKGFITIAFIL